MEDVITFTTSLKGQCHFCHKELALNEAGAVLFMISASGNPVSAEPYCRTCTDTVRQMPAAQEMALLAHRTITSANNRN